MSSKIGIYKNGIRLFNKSNKIQQECINTREITIFNPTTWEVETREFSANYAKKNNNIIRGNVCGFSKKSKRNLSWLYMQGEWNSMITVTYHKKYPQDGKESKKHMNKLCEEFTKCNLKYLWVLEWQGRGYPHYHIWLSCKLSYDEVQYFGKKWTDITKEFNDTVQSFDFHQNVGRIYTDWLVKVGIDYSVKYASKSEQKGLPLNVTSYGRWFGNSRSLEINPEIEVLFDSENPEDNIKCLEMIKFNRNVHRCISHWRKKTKKTIKRKKRSALAGFYYILSLSRKSAIERLLDYHTKIAEKKLLQFNFL